MASDQDSRPSVESTWRPIGDETESSVITETFDTLDAARHSALSLACCAGALQMRVTDAHGATRYAWDRSDNLFRAIPEANPSEAAP